MLKTPPIAALLALCLASSCASSSPAPTAESGADSSISGSQGAASEATAADRLDAELDAIWALNMERHPTWATYEGIRTYDDRLSDPSAEAIEAYIEDFAAITARVEAIPTAELDPMARDTQRLVAQKLDQMRQARVCKSERWSVNGLGGPQVDYAMLPVFHEVRNPEDLANLEKRYRAIPAQMDANIANLRAGVKSGHTPAKVNVEQALQQLEAALAVPISDDPMLRVSWSDGVDPMPLDSLQEAVAQAARPALERYRDVLRDEVLPAARTKPGVASLTDGATCYRTKMIGHIGEGFDPEALHAEGLRQLELSQAGMLEVGAELGLDVSSHTDVIAAVRANPDNFATSEEQLLELNRAVVTRAQAAMPTAFGRLPKTPLEVRPIEAHRAGDAPAAYYYSAPEDGSRPGIYYVNTDSPETRPLYNLEALAFHESVPGHHLQIALASELPEVHVWRRSQGQTAYVEGWGLYAEKLADEMGLYSSPEMRFGMHNYQAWRAARLVIDTGLHHFGWSRAKAVAFLADNTGLPQNEVENEVDRYIAWPGQALAYMVGRLTIEELRAEAKAELGKKFDLVAFHDEVHAYGAVPLTILRRNIRAWIAESKSD